MQEAYFEDSFSRTNIPYQELQSRTILVTGANGMIGRAVINGLAYLNETFHLSLHVIAMVRDVEKAKKCQGEKMQRELLEFEAADVTNPIKIEQRVDYIIHAAAVTKSKSMAEQPVEVIRTNVYGTFHILELARENPGCKVIYLSSMEVYGFEKGHDILTEDNIKYLNPLLVRSCYPESKRMAENLCVSYAAEYGTDVKIIRLAQTFGPGADKKDTRVFAQFVRCALEKKDIILHTDGETRQMYLDTADAVTAILTVLLLGKSGTAYNAANKNTYCSIKEMAELVCEKFTGNSIQVRIVKNSQTEGRYPASHDCFLDMTKIEELGWSPGAGLEEMYKRMIEG